LLATGTGPPKRATSADALIFYGHLQLERPDLLHFRALGDKWQHGHGFFPTQVS